MILKILLLFGVAVVAISIWATLRKTIEENPPGRSQSTAWGLLLALVFFGLWKIIELINPF